MKKIYIAGISVFIILCVASLLFYKKNPLSATVTIGNTQFIVETAVTAKEKEKGLGYRKELAPQHGMIFIYDHKEQYSFWMKGMNFPLDFVWFDGNEVVDITENVPATQTIPFAVVTPKKPIDKVLELNAGEVEKYDIQIGDRAVFNK